MNEEIYPLIMEADEKISSAISIVRKEYINNGNYEILPLPKEIQELSIQNSIRLLKMNTFFFEEGDRIREKLSQILSSMHSLDCSIIVIFNSDGVKCDYYIGVKSLEKVSNCFSALQSSISGNFPGSLYSTDYSGKEIESLVSQITDEKNNFEITSVLGIPTTKSNESNISISTGLENVIYGMKNRKITSIIIADPVLNQEIEKTKENYEEMYSNLSILKSTSFTLSNNVSDSKTTSFSESLSNSKGYNESTNETNSFSNSSSKGQSRLSKGSKISKGVLAAAAITTLPFSAPLGIGLSVAGNLVDGLFGGQDSEGISSSTNKSTSLTMGTNFSETNSIQNSHGLSSTTGEGQTIQYNQQNKKVSNFLENLDKQIERLKMGSSIGLWNVGTYFLSENPQDSIIAANIFSGNLKGSDSDIEKYSITTFKDAQSSKQLRDYLYNFSNPLIRVNDNFFAPSFILASVLSTSELSQQINLPRKSIQGLNVDKYVNFGVNIPVTDRDKIEIGKLYHLNQTLNQSFFLEIEKLKEHTLVVGTTGSGKSNTIYKILEELGNKCINFLVIEPTKGEYKDVFGGRSDVKVYGTNPTYTELLRINPFVFPKSIHILEHIDRLIEIFTATWPLYAAMPSILKEAVEKTYEIKGWDLCTSKSIGITEDFPSFSDLLHVIPTIIENSEYSSEVKSNYVGALVTRVKSLTNGLYGMIFAEEEHDNFNYFSNNCIIDLSRIGSIETKSLIMGLLTLKLQEYRIDENITKNSNLRHVTIIEEAHHLLKKSSISSSENTIQAKSVEMIINSIAEMRTYGEGFIIVDQNPTLLDQSVIKNTNTKIVLRLPDAEDRILVGHSSNLNEKQINEIGRLRRGIASVFQSGWGEACLCAIDLHSNEQPYHRQSESIKFEENKLKDMLLFLLNNRVSIDLRNKFSSELFDLKLQNLKKLEIPYSILRKIFDNIENHIGKKTVVIWEEENYNELSNCIANIVNHKKILLYLEKFNTIEEWHDNFLEIIKKLYLIDEKEYALSIIQCILYSVSLNNENAKKFYFTWITYIKQESAL